MTTVQARISSFSIQDSSGKTVFSLDATKKSFQFSNETLQQEVTSGIFILPIARSSYEGRASIGLPDSNNGVSFQLFAQAVRYYFSDHLQQDGFKLIEAKA